jgi:cytidyltransferase-like protein
MSKVINNLNQISSIGKNIILCHGVFDLIHQGHLLHFKDAKKICGGGTLIVSVTDDPFVNKGPNRPYFTANQRLMMLENLSIVDYVYLSKYPNAINALKTFLPQFYVKGQEYKNFSKDITGNIIKEIEFAKKIDCKVIYTNNEVYSSTKIISKKFNIHASDATEALNNIKRKYKISKIEKIINNIGNFNPLILGDPLFDIYNFVKILGNASKAPVISTEFINSEKHLGGTLAVGKMFKNLNSKIQLLILNNVDKSNKNFIKKSFDHNSVVFLNYFNCDILEKERFISNFKNQVLFQISSKNFNEKDKIIFSKEKLLKINSFLKKKNLILLDFGLNIYNQDMLIKLFHTNYKNLFLNVQTNSNNYGFNLFTKYKRFKYLSITKREFELGIKKKINNVIHLKSEIKKVFKNKSFISVTLGKEGSLFLNKKKNIFYMPTFFNQPLDTTGCGDAYFAVTSALISNGYDDEIVPFIGNVYAGLHSLNMGNKKFPTSSDLTRAITYLLS